MTNAVLHELAHAKSNIDELMHNENPNGILAKKGGFLGRVFIDNDVRWIAKHLSKQVTFELKHFTGE